MLEAAELQDPYRALGRPMHFLERLEHLYRVLREQFDGIQRFAMALYDSETDLLSTFIYESDDSSPLLGYSVQLADVPSLQRIASGATLRVVDDMRCFRSQVMSVHTRALLEQGYRSSFTMPLIHENSLKGFLFLNSASLNYFDAPKATYCNLWAHLVGQQLAHEQEAVQRMQALVHFATDVSGRRSVETESHVRRMAAYARLLARELQSEWHLSDAFVEYLTLFAPLHDIGKIAISDSILHKPGPLTADEFETMKKHVSVGRDIVDQAIRHFSLGEMEYADMLRNIVQFHHEKLNGTGYLGCTQQEVPVEARIIAVADILDALLSARSYKEPWTLEKTLSVMSSMADANELDAAVVAVLHKRQEKIEQIRARYP
ncbi:HD-GYP domain-containing protein [Thalassolituus sp. LLYu03]|uniref:HD-GYP domain-containing protein n=1 Tax=Thalassolituus sp. LLYu03 TaxID=3421656 RepID=UPI003D2DDB68